MTIQWDKVWEAVKLPLRLIVLGILPILIVYVSKIPTIYGEILYTALVIIDKYLHLIWEESKGVAQGIYQTRNGNPVGLSPF